MAAQAPKQWGVTPPISTALPTAKDNSLNDLLIAELRANNNYETPEETNKRCVEPSDYLTAHATLIEVCRTEVLKSLHKITVEFVKHVGREKGLPSALIDSAGGKIFTFGSFRLGVFGPGARSRACSHRVHIY